MDDKHLQPIDFSHLYSENDETVTFPYHSIELIFNNRNVWGNMQNHDPNSIYFDVQDPDKWFPYV